MVENSVKSLRLAFTYSLSLFIVFFVPLLLWQTTLAKNALQVDWLDIATEGALFILSMCWLMVIVSVRPSGSVTNLLIAGLSSYCLGCYLDLLDEIFIVKTLGIYNWFEKMPTPLGLLVLTYGLWRWRDEQAVVNRQLQTREQYHREHHLTDSLTLLNDAKAFEHHLTKALSQHQSFGLIMLDIDHFHSINQKLGMDEGDKLLTQLANWLSSVLRNQDIVCRYSGDRFVILLKDVIPSFVGVMAEQLEHGVTRSSGVDCSATLVWILPSPKMITSSAIELTSKDEALMLLQSLNQKMSQQKDSRPSKQWKSASHLSQSEPA
ncbi:diguanylate cyclase [Shewanella sp. A25]|nr:diguanylate cyclase [Shewanella shenzhenensis]